MELHQETQNVIRRNRPSSDPSSNGSKNQEAFLAPDYTDGIKVIAPSLGKRFSGINASMLAVIPEQAKLADIAALGFHIDGPGVPRIGFQDFFKHCRKGKWTIWHARRNVDMLAGLVLKKLFKFKLILIFTSAAQRNHSWITRFYIRRMEEIITPTTAAASFLKRDAIVVPHGVDVDLFHPPENRGSEWKGRNLPGKHGIGVFGRIRPNKGTREFVEATIQVLRNHPDWTAVIIGQTTSEHRAFEQELRFMIKKAHLEDRILFPGFQKDALEISKWYRSLSIVACTSHVEGFGLTCLESMASGCAVVATCTGAWPEIITRGKNGFLIPTKSSNALAEKLEMLIDDPQKRTDLGMEAIKTVHHEYKIKNEAKGIQLVYTKLLDSRKETRNPLNSNSAV